MPDLRPVVEWWNVGKQWVITYYRKSETGYVQVSWYHPDLECILAEFPNAKVYRNNVRIR
jgi:hypothetical protein